MWSQILISDAGYRLEDVRKLCFCIHEAGKKHLSSENHREWVGGKPILFKAHYSIFSKLPRYDPIGLQ